MIYSRTYQTIPLLIVATIWYLVLSTTLTLIEHYIEHRLSDRPLRLGRSLPRSFGASSGACAVWRRAHDPCDAPPQGRAPDKKLRHPQGPERHRPRGRGGRRHLHHRPLRLRQEHLPPMLELSRGAGLRVRSFSMASRSAFDGRATGSTRCRSTSSRVSVSAWAWFSKPSICFRTRQHSRTSSRRRSS